MSMPPRNRPHSDLGQEHPIGGELPQSSAPLRTLRVRYPTSRKGAVAEPTLERCHMTRTCSSLTEVRGREERTRVASILETLSLVSPVAQQCGAECPCS